MPTKLATLRFIIKQIKQIVDNPNVTAEQKLEIIVNIVGDVKL